jgi:UDP-glucose:(heptosyl)LPS alpha-1,3-glucosyltransferase
MRIAMLVRRFDPAGGGTERDFAAAARGLADGGHEVRIYAARTRVRAWRGMAVRALPVAWFPRSLEVAGFGLLAARFARRERAELTISFGRTIDSDLIRCEGGAHAAYLEAARQWESAAASAARAISPYHALQCRIEARAFSSRRLRMVLAISRLVADDLQARFAIASGKLMTLYNGIDRERFKHLKPGAREAIRRRFGIDSSNPAVLFIGNGFARKGLGQLLQAWPISTKKAHLIVVGEDRASEQYQSIARRLRIDDRVLFLGRRNEIADLLAAADAVALTSLFEAFGNVVLEGMAAGVPVLTSARCGAAEVLPAQLREFVVQDPMNPAEIAQRLDSLLEAPREIGAIAQAAAAQFTWERYANRLLEVIQQTAISNSVSG